MKRIVMITTAACAAAMGGACGSTSDGQAVDVSRFDEFQFSRTVTIADCFSQGDLVWVGLSGPSGGRQVSYAVLTAAADSDGEAPCMALTESGACLVQSETTTRVLADIENRRIDSLFAKIIITNRPHELCGGGNVTLCSEDLYVWDGLSVSGDFCRPVHVGNGHEIMGLLEELRDGPPEEDPTSAGLFDPFFEPRPWDILRHESIIASDQLLGKNGDFTVIRTQADLDGVLLQDGSAQIDFSQEMGVAAVVIRPPCQEFTSLQATETAVTVDIRAALERDPDCSFDLGSIDAYLVVIPSTPKRVRLFLNGSELDEIRL